MRPRFLFLMLCLVARGSMATPCVSAPVDPALFHAIPLAARVQPATPALAALALRRNLGNGVTVKPYPARSDHPLLPALHRMLANLPAPIHRLARQSVAAIYPLQGNFGSARAEAARDAQGRLVGGCILLNLDTLSRSANDWASWREESAFRSEAPYRIRVTLEPPQTDTAEHALRFVFLHELGHLLGMAAGVHGFWAAPETWGKTIRSPYTRLSWRIDGNVLTSEWKQRFPLLAQPRFYRFENAPLPRSAAPAIYRLLAQTNWPSLYGSIDPYEDFAEALALYLHTRLLGRPYAVNLYRNQTHIAQFHSCLDTGRCPRKAAYLEQLLSGIDATGLMFSIFHSERAGGGRHGCRQQGRCLQAGTDVLTTAPDGRHPAPKTEKLM